MMMGLQGSEPDPEAGAPPASPDARSQALVCVVDDDPEIRACVSGLLGSVGLAVQGYGSAEEFFATSAPDVPGCVLIDVRLPEISGLKLQQRLGETGDIRPVILMSGHGDVPMAVRAMKAGALHFFEKPFDIPALLACIERAIQQDAGARERRRLRHLASARLACLTERELEVVSLVVKGKLNKEIARALKIAQKTVELHRSKVMRKTGAGHVSELVRLVLESRDDAVRVS